MTQPHVARHCRVTQQAIQRMEAGEVARPRYIDELAEILQAPKEWLKTGKGPRPSPMDFRYNQDRKLSGGVGDSGYKGTHWQRKSTPAQEVADIMMVYDDLSAEAKKMFEAAILARVPSKK